MPQPTMIRDSIMKRVEVDLRHKFNIPPEEPLPQNLKTILEKTAMETDTVLTNRYVKKEAMMAGRAVLQNEQFEGSIKNRLTSALKGVQIITQSEAVQAMLDENARMLFMKKKALIKAGFNESEAFQLILAEVTSKKSR